jgi:hypothetical protein
VCQAKLNKSRSLYTWLNRFILQNATSSQNYKCIFVKISSNKSFKNFKAWRNRGGDQVSHKLHKSKSEVRTFLKELRGQESHYGRNKSKRIYLNSNLSIAKLYKIYKSAPQDQPIKKVSFSTFHRIFSNEFNIGFKSPASDICSLCQRLGNSIKREKDITKKRTLLWKNVFII